MKNLIPLPLYKKILENTVISCVDIVLLTEKGVLLLRRDNEPGKGLWWLPGGRIFKGEKIVEAAARKLKEECGLDIAPQKLKIVGVGETMFNAGPFEVSSVHTVNSVVTVKIKNISQVKVDTLHSEYKFQKSGNGLHEYVRWAIKESKKVS